jgi:HK97 family phage prohead protease
MTMIRKLVQATINTLGPDEVEITMSTAALARDGHILIPQGCLLDNYRANPIVLWQHDPEHPVASAENIQVEPDSITARVRFAPDGISHKADEVRGLVKAGIVRAVSVGFDPIDGVPLDPKKPRGGQRFTKWELLECSFCSVPVDTGAIVTARAEKLPDPKEKSKVSDEKSGVDDGIRQAQKRALARVPSVPKFRGLFEVAQLACQLEQLGFAKDCADWETALEGDNSEVPGMLGEALMALGEALIAMTHEEVGELMDAHESEDGAGEEPQAMLGEEQHAYIAAAPNARARQWRRGIAIAKLRSGKMLSEETVRCLRSALDDHAEAMDHQRAAMRAHKRAIGTVNDLMDRAGVPAEEADAENKDGDSKDIQKSDGVAEDEGSRSVDYRRRQSEKLALSAVH